MMTTLEKVRKLEKYIAFRRSDVDSVIENTLTKLISREYDRMTELKKCLSDQLISFEKQYALESDVFYQQYESGELGDAVDFTEWSATIEMLHNVRCQLALLEPDNAQ